jgi:hypothetical protein
MARVANVHAAELVLASPDADPARPGAVITVELCGQWDHEGPCRWPHHTSADRRGDALAVRTTFASDPAEVPDLLERMGTALRADDGWSVTSAGLDTPTATEAAMASGWCAEAGEA